MRTIAILFFVVLFSGTAPGEDKPESHFVRTSLELIGKCAFDTPGDTIAAGRAFTYIYADDVRFRFFVVHSIASRNDRLDTRSDLLRGELDVIEAERYEGDMVLFRWDQLDHAAGEWVSLSQYALLGANTLGGTSLFSDDSYPRCYFWSL